MEPIKILFTRLLLWSAQQIVRRYRPTVIGVTGSVGKTSAKEAIYTVLSKKLTVRRNLKSYNNDFGVPLTVIGSASGGRSVLKWAGVVFQAVALLLFRRFYPKVLVLEMGVDRPGDLKKLTKRFPCNIGVVTAIGTQEPVHVEFFRDATHLVKEKTIMVAHLSRNDVAVLNRDDPRVWEMRKATNAKVISFGFHAEADVRASDLLMGQTLPDPTSPTLGGIHFKLHAKGSVIPVDLPGVLGAHQVFPALIAAAIGLHVGMHLVEIAEALKSYQSPPGRMRLIPGVKQTLIIDDSYNASPAAVIAALETLAQFEMVGRTIVVLGNMAELGKESETAHAEIGRKVLDVAEVLVTVGDLGKEIARSAERAGMSRDVIFTFDHSAEAGRFLQDHLQPLDVLLVKGSQSMRMEKIVKELMTEPLRAQELLVRQEPSWLKRDEGVSSQT